MSLESAPQVEFDLHLDERIEIDDDDDVLRRELASELRRRLSPGPTTLCPL